MIFDPLLDLFRGKAVTVPPLDGAFRPNTALDEAPVLAEMPAPDALVSQSGRLLASSGKAVLEVAEGGRSAAVAEFASTVTALAVSPAGAVATGLESGKLLIDGKEQSLPGGVRCITALAFAPDGALWLANGSAMHPPSAWVRDLMERNASGSVWRRDPGSGDWREIAGSLAFPFGLLPDGDGVVVSESWRHRLLRVHGGNKRAVALADLPGYPARLSPAAGGGAWLALFAPRNRLVEFVLDETHYRADMLADVPPEHWIAPALSTRRSFLEPLQCGGIRTMGVHKPWSPSRSYGLVVRLDRAMRPVSSRHSRADGLRHGTTSAAEHAGRLVVASKGGDCLLALDLGGER